MITRTACIIPTHNDEDTLKEAVDSILAGGVPIDIFVIDDASEIPASNLLKGDLYKSVFIFRVEKNIGITKAINFGLKKCLARKQYNFIARMDADDVSYPGRIAKQIDFLERHPNIMVVGTASKHIQKETGELIRYSINPESPDDIQKKIPLYCCLTQPTCMFRAKCFEMFGLFDERFATAQDYEMFYRLSKVTMLANMPECLLDYRVSAKSTSVKKFHYQSLCRLRIQIKYFNPLKKNCWIGIAKSILLISLPRKVSNFLRNKR